MTINYPSALPIFIEDSFRARVRGIMGQPSAEISYPVFSTLFADAESGVKSDEEFKSSSDKVRYLRS
jgi:hypothetical protein